MKVKNEKEYLSWKENNNDAYGRDIFRYAERWANLMEERIANGEKVKDIATKTSNEADTGSITCFMYGVAFSILTHCWEHGDELNDLRNRRYLDKGKEIINKFTERRCSR